MLVWYINRPDVYDYCFRISGTNIFASGAHRKLANFMDWEESKQSRGSMKYKVNEVTGPTSNSLTSSGMVETWTQVGVQQDSDPNQTSKLILDR